MQRWLLGLTVLLAGTVGLAHADYVVIVANVGATKEKPPAQGGQFQGGAGALGAFGNQGGFNAQGGGFNAQGGGFNAQGGAPPGVMGAGGQGARGGGGGGMAMPPGGFPGAIGFQGAQGGMGFPGGQGAQGGMGFPGGAGGFGQLEDDVELAGVFVVAVVETKNAVDSRYFSAIGPTGWSMPFNITTKWGTTKLVQDKRQLWVLPLVNVDSKPLPSMSKKWETKNKEVHGTKEAPLPAALLDLAEWALTHGMLAEFLKTMDELAVADKENPTVKNYLQVKADLAKPAPPNKDLLRWKSRLSVERFKGAEKEKGHYTLLHDNPTNDTPDVQARLNRLEDNLQTFLYWFALKGKVLTVPAQRLLVVMPPKPADFDAAKQKFDAPVVADGFFSHRDNIAVFASQRIDPQYEDLHSVVSTRMQNIGDPNLLLKGRGDPDMQTLMVMLKTLEEDGELATASHDGTRQLLAAVGLKGLGEPERPLLPRTVVAPEWIQFGVSSVFETPSSSPWVNIGLPSVACMPQYNYLSQFQEAARLNKVDQAPIALTKVVTDQYFREASNPKDKEHKANLLKARMMSWSVAYFLSQKRLDGLLRYFRELDKLPRDLEFDNEVLLGAFARAFDLTSASNPAAVDSTKLAAFAQEWRSYITNLPDEMKDIVKEIRDIQKVSRANQNQPAGGGNPNAPAGPAGPGGPVGPAGPGAPGIGGGGKPGAPGGGS
jgi:hypothetical protein